jgi:hypothetical protein
MNFLRNFCLYPLSRSPYHKPRTDSRARVHHVPHVDDCWLQPLYPHRHQPPVLLTPGNDPLASARANTPRGRVRARAGRRRPGSTRGPCTRTCAPLENVISRNSSVSVFRVSSKSLMNVPAGERDPRAHEGLPGQRRLRQTEHVPGYEVGDPAGEGVEGLPADRGHGRDGYLVEDAVSTRKEVAPYGAPAPARGPVASP